MKHDQEVGPVSTPVFDSSDPQHANALLDAWARRLPGIDASAVPLFAMATALGRQVEQFLEGVLKPHGVQLSDYRVLVALYTSEEGAITPAQLNGILRQTSAGITKTISRVEQRGLVQRRPNPNDSRSVFIELTEEGEEEIQRLCELVAQEQNKKIAWLSDEQRETAIQGIQTFLQAMR